MECLGRAHKFKMLGMQLAGMVLDDDGRFINNKDKNEKNKFINDNTLYAHFDVHAYKGHAKSMYHEKWKYQIFQGLFRPLSPMVPT